MVQPREIVKLTVYNVVDNETDGLSSPCHCCDPAEAEPPVADYTDAIRIVVGQDDGTKVDLQKLCVAAHGLSLLLVAEYIDEETGERRQEQLLFDTGPVPDVWSTNARNLKLDLSKINTLVLSHYHMDHFGGFDGAIPDIVQAKRDASNSDPLLVDLSSPMIVERGIKNPINNQMLKLIPDTPSASTIKDQWGANLELHEEAHTAGDGCFYVSGFIPRETSFETGLPHHYSKMNGEFVLDTDVKDERYVAVKIKGRGVLVFSACSHAGIVNVCRSVTKQLDTSKLVAIVGGFHLAGRNTEDRTEKTIQGLQELNPDLILAGHCTGWKAKAQFTTAFPDNFQVLSVGGRYVFNSM